MVGGGGGYELQPRHRSIHRLLTPRSTLPRLPLPAFKSATVWLTRHRLPESLFGGWRSSGALDGSVRLSETDVLRAAVTKAANFPKLRHRCSLHSFFAPPRPTDQSSQLLALLSSCCRCCCWWLSQKADANSRSLARFSHSDTAPLPNPPISYRKTTKDPSKTPPKFPL